MQMEAFTNYTQRVNKTSRNSGLSFHKPPAFRLLYLYLILSYFFKRLFSITEVGFAIWSCDSFLSFFLLMILEKVKAAVNQILTLSLSVFELILCSPDGAVESYWGPVVYSSSEFWCLRIWVGAGFAFLCMQCCTVLSYSVLSRWRKVLESIY